VTPSRANYGIDAPGVVRNLALGGAAGVVLGVLVGNRVSPVQRVIGRALFSWGLLSGGACLLTAVAMVLSSKVGKLRERDWLLDRLDLRGDETVLDVGCGRGLLLVGAARRLTAGKAIGVDIWQGQDQSGNRPDATWANARAEGVADRVEIKDGDARRLPFPDNTFEAVVSNLVLHNIYNRSQRDGAVREIARVLKPGGRLGLLDIAHTAEYTQVLRDLGWPDVQRSGPHFRIFPLVRAVIATKPERADRT
jgi:arsenite methyltransferase